MCVCVCVCVFFLSLCGFGGFRALVSGLGGFDALASARSGKGSVRARLIYRFRPKNDSLGFK